MTSERPQNTVIIFAALALVVLLATLDQTIVATALPNIVDSLGDIAHLSWVAAAYLLATMVVGPIYGKLGDLYGRKVTLQVAICLFLVGSVLCGLSRSMLELILFRALQGLGGGGLIVTTMAVIGDIAPPRDRGKYQGYFGAVIGVSTVAGPLLGGYFVEQLSWRWIFFINVPLGMVALAVIAFAFRTPAKRRDLSIDYPGALLLSAALTCMLLITDPAGAGFSWDSSQRAGLVVSALLLLGAFVFVEARAHEPILPLVLFRNPVFSVCSAISFVAGVEMFGAVTFLPLYMQVVKGMSPSVSGMQLAPMMAGVIVSSALSGMLISRFGVYKIFPVTGMLLVTAACWLLSENLADASSVEIVLCLLALGFGLGFVMQVLVLAAQNAVPRSELGVATSVIVLFRSLGGALGVSTFGTVFSSGLQSSLARLIPDDTGYSFGIGVGALRLLPDSIRQAYIASYISALKPLFLIAAALGLLGFLLALMLRETPLHDNLAVSAKE